MGARVLGLDAEQLAAQAGSQLSCDVSVRWHAPELSARASCRGGTPK
jgi:hypothetical protein